MTSNDPIGGPAASHSDSRRREWDESYRRRENFVFSPSDEVVRFISRHIRRRIGIDEFIDIAQSAAQARVLDVGCGIGRNLVYGSQMGLDMYGIEHSSVAVGHARRWLKTITASDAFEKQVVEGDARRLPWADRFFDHALSDSVLDSMPFDFATAVVNEIHRVLKPRGLFYCNLISGMSNPDVGDNPAEVVVESSHERNTIQAYYDHAAALHLFRGFAIMSCTLATSVEVASNRTEARWHVVMRKS